jgi:hypothetical protein
MVCPVPGLDVTTELRVALFFALHTFSVEGEDLVCRRTPPGSGDCVVYCLVVAEPEWAIDYERLVPTLTTAARPRAQRARFLANAWRYARNGSARNIYCAFYLSPDVDWGEDVPSYREMFPSPDLFGDWLTHVQRCDVGSEAAALLAGYRRVVSA